MFFHIELIKQEKNSIFLLVLSISQILLFISFVLLGKNSVKYFKPDICKLILTTSVNGLSSFPSAQWWQLS